MLKLQSDQCHDDSGVLSPSHLVVTKHDGQNMLPNYGTIDLQLTNDSELKSPRDNHASKDSSTKKGETARFNDMYKTSFHSLEIDQPERQYLNTLDQSFNSLLDSRIEQMNRAKNGDN